MLSNSVVQETHAKSLLGAEDIRGTRLGPHRAVLALPLGRVEGGVGFTDQGILIALSRGCYAKTGRDPQGALAVEPWDAQSLDRPADALADRIRALEVGVGKDDCHLLASIARRNVDVARGLAQGAGNMLEHHVALRVSVAVVDRLEVVEVEHDQT